MAGWLRCRSQLFFPKKILCPLLSPFGCVCLNTLHFTVICLPTYQPKGTKQAQCHLPQGQPSVCMPLWRPSLPGPHTPLFSERAEKLGYFESKVFLMFWLQIALECTRHRSHTFTKCTCMLRCGCVSLGHSKLAVSISVVHTEQGASYPQRRQTRVCKGEGKGQSSSSALFSWSVPANPSSSAGVSPIPEFCFSVSRVWACKR